ncbi:MAG: IgGFc-binding protein [Flavobacteriales bacterium]|nr:IgGFc-binding protein [Flavobacteriales bacterium]
MVNYSLSVLLFFAVPSLCAQSSTGTEHWVTFMENLDLQFNQPPSFHIVVSSEYPAVGQLEFPSTGFTIPFTVSGGTEVVIDLPTNSYYADGDEATFDHGMRITSDVPVSVYAYHDRLYFSEASLILPRSMLGSHYTVLAREDDLTISPSEFVVLATADDTEVELTPAVLTAGFRPPGVPFTVLLNAGQSIQIQAFEDLSGSFVRSLDPEKPIAVFSGARQAKVNCSNGGADDHLYNQLFPTEHWGRDFLLIPYSGRNGDEVRVIAAMDGTQVTIGPTQYALDAGEVIQLNATTPMRIFGSSPIAVGQFNDSQTCNNATGDPAFLFVPPIDHTDRRVIWNSRDSDGTPEHFVNVHVSAVSGIGSIHLDGMDISSLFQPVPNVNGYWYLQHAIAEGAHELISDKPFQAVAYSFGEFNSCTYALGFERDVTTGWQEGDGTMHRQDQFAVRSEGWTPDWSIEGAEDLRVMDLSGRTLIRTRYTMPGTIDLSGLVVGVYVYEREKNGERSGVGRLVVR